MINVYEDLIKCPVRTRVWFEGEKKPYRVRARNKRFLVCTKPFNLQHTVLYTIVDLTDQVRGTENVVFGMGAETDRDCLEMLVRLIDGAKQKAEDPTIIVAEGDGTEVSRRNRVPLKVTRVS